jgi:hypothetical protein
MIDQRKNPRNLNFSTILGGNSIHIASVGDPDPEPDPDQQDPHVFGPPDPDLLIRGTDPTSDPAPDPSLFS